MYADNIVSVDPWPVPYRDTQWVRDKITLNRSFPQSESGANVKLFERKRKTDIRNQPLFNSQVFNYVIGYGGLW